MEFIRRINWVDILAIILLIRTTYVSLQAGLSSELFSLLGVYLNVVLALNYYAKIGHILSGTIPGFPLVLANFVSFLGIAVILAILFRFIGGVLDRVIKIEWHPLIESVGGLVAGLARSCLAVSLVLIILILLPLPYMQWSIRDRSLSGTFFLKIGLSVYAKSIKVLPAFVKNDALVDTEELMVSLTEDKPLNHVQRKNETP